MTLQNPRRVIPEPKFARGPKEFEFQWGVVPVIPAWYSHKSKPEYRERKGPFFS